MLPSPLRFQSYPRWLLQFFPLAILIAASAASAPARDKPDLTQLFERYKVKQCIVKQPQGLLKHPYLVPSGPYFQLFDWDSYFMGVALSYDETSAEPLENSVEDFLEFVGPNASEGGYVPREIAPDGFFLWFNGVESGVDSNPAVWDRPAQVTEGVNLQCYLYREYRAMALLAGKLGYTQDAKDYARKADDLRNRIRDEMWS